MTHVTTDGQDFASLNREFYSADPAGYFRTRFHLFVLAGARAEDLAAMLDGGVTYEGIRVMPDEADEGDGTWPLAFAVTESQVLLHHASEALIRFFLAHEDLPPCPWITSTELRNPRQFRDAVDRLAASIWTDEQRANVASVFVGQDGQLVDKRALEAAAGAETLVRALAKRLNEDANMYNSMKHGMAIMPGEASVALWSETSTASLGGSGPSVAFLELARDQHQQGKISQTTRWIDIGQTLMLCAFAIAEIEALWTVAQARYLGREIEGVPYVTTDAIAIALGQSQGSKTGGITRFSRTVAARIR